MIARDDIKTPVRGAKPTAQRASSGAGLFSINQEDRIVDARHQQRLAVAGGFLGALAASSCCILPLVLFSLGVSGAWIGNFTQLAPYQPYASQCCTG